MSSPTMPGAAPALWARLPVRTLPPGRAAPVAAIAALALMAGCATTPPVEPVPPPPPGMELLMGQTAETALQLLGTPRLDRREGPARQLQFSGPCILDLFYYPRNGQAPVATHAEARLTNGVASSPGDCLKLLLQIRAVASG